MFDRHTYAKGALVLPMPRNLIGDESFFKILSHFLHRYAFDAVDTSDFIRSVKTVTGQKHWMRDLMRYMRHSSRYLRRRWRCICSNCRV